MPNYSSGSGFSDSSSYPVQTPENDIINQLSGVAAGLASQMHQWAQGVFAQTSQITNQAVGNFFNVSQKMLGLSDNLTDQYNNVFAPQNRSLAAEANSYNSAERQKIDMGQAGATQAQASDAGRHNAEAALQSYGINPNDGKYASLEHASAVQEAANVAGAMNTQRNVDAQTGQRLRSEAVQVGAQLPAAISNVNNTALQANTGASNASLANANTGANLNRLSNEYLKTAMDVKLPPMGSTSHQENKNSSGPGSGMSSNGWPNSGPSSSGGPSYNGGGSSKEGPAWMPEHGDGTGGMGGGYDGSQPGPAIHDYGGGGGEEEPPPPPPPPQEYTGPYQDTGQFGGDYYTGGAGGERDYSGGSDFGNANAGGYDTGTPGGDFYAGDYTPPSDDNVYNYAAGGAISGPLPPQMSPSGGQQTDDIQAQGPQGSQLNLNAGEFVIPQDVALWKGQEFFQKLIDSSRRLRMTAPAQGKPMAGAQQHGA